MPVLIPLENTTSLSFDPTGQYIAVTSCPDLSAPTGPCNGSISLFDLQEQSWRELGSYNYNIGNVKFSPDGRFIAFEKDEIRAWGIQVIDLTTNDTFSIVDRDFTNLVSNYAFDFQSNSIAISNGDIAGESFSGLSVWRLSDQTLQAFTEGRILAADLTFAETKHNIMFVTHDTEVFLWNYQTGAVSSLSKLNQTLRDNLNRLSFSYPPIYLLAALLDDWHPGDRMLFVWDIQSGEQVFFQDMPEGSFADLIAISTTGEYIAFSSTVNEQKTVEIWEQSTGTSHQILMDH